METLNCSTFLQTDLEELSADTSPQEILDKLSVLSLLMNLLGPCC